LPPLTAERHAAANFLYSNEAHSPFDYLQNGGLNYVNYVNIERTQGASAGSDESSDHSNGQETTIGKNQIDVRGAANRAKKTSGTARPGRDRDSMSLLAVVLSDGQAASPAFFL
jgi:hypothetical protein